VTGLCTITWGEVQTLLCDLCDLYLREGVVLARGVVLDPDDVVELGRARAPLAPIDGLYIAPDRRPVRLVASGPGHPAEGAPTWPEVTSLTIHFARPRTVR
jgi:hypothetical protein